MRTYLGLILLCLLILLSCQSARKRNQGKPNILLIIVDDMGYADFESFDHHASDINTPNIKRLANSGTVFTQAYTTGPVCSPSRAGLNTGKYQFRWDSLASWMPGLPENVKTMAEYLREAGYHTARIGKSDYGRGYHRHDTREYPLNHGYDYFLGFSAHAHDFWLSSAEIRERTPDPDNPSAHLGPLMHNRGEKSLGDDAYLTEVFTDEAIEFLGGEHENPFFLVLSYNAVHHLIHQNPQEYLDKYGLESIPNYDPDSLVHWPGRATGSYAAYFYRYLALTSLVGDEKLRMYYLANLECLDDNLGRVLDVMDEKGLRDETLVVFMSDNGGSNLTGSDNRPLSGAKFALYEGGIRIPMVMSWPGHLPEGGTFESLVSTTDILPTIAGIAGMEIDDVHMDGMDLTGNLVSGKELPEDRMLIWKWQKTFAIRKGAWKLTNAHDQWGPPGYISSKFYLKPVSDDNSLKLFNIETDISERTNLSGTHPEKVMELLDAYQIWCEEQIGVY